MQNQTPLYYCTCSGLIGLCFHVGSVQLFTPTKSNTVYTIPVGATVVITSRVPHLMESFLREIIEKRLANLGNGGWGYAVTAGGAL
jgi:hypothetical protein